MKMCKQSYIGKKGQTLQDLQAFSQPAEVRKAD